jgi:DNA repair exonuclease SbcCD ATPase subunit
MLKTYRIIPLVFILFLFGFTFITVSLVSADERDAFVQCQQMPTQPNNFKSLKRQKNCFRDVAKRLGAKKREGAFGACQRVSTQKMQQKIDCFMDVASSLMPNTAPPAGAIGMPPTMAAPPAASPAAPQRNGVARRGGIMGGNNAPLPPSRQVIQSNKRIAELEAENARLLEQQRASADQSGGEVAQLNARIVESESQVATLTTTNAQLQEQLRSARSQTEALVAKTSELEVKFATPRDAEQVFEEMCLSNLPLWVQLSKIQIKHYGGWNKTAIFSALTDQCTPRNARQKLQHIFEDQNWLRR